MKWIKSSKCDGGTCVQVGWAQSSFCEGGSCAQVNHDADNMIGVRNSRIPGEVVWFDSGEWAAFVAGVKAGEFDI